VSSAIKKVMDWAPGPLAALVNNAGHEIVPDWWSKPLHKLPPAEVEKAVRAVAAVDLDGARWMTYHALPLFLKARRGSFVYVSSTPALAGYQGFPYTEAKAAVLGLMRDVARVYGPKGIRANAVAPGNIRTSWLEKVSPKERKALETENPLRRFGEPREVATAILFLASNLSSFVTGETIVVDGGTVIR
jgi:3-oxoacyl-[acyl-carrier protein] reductase